MRIFDSQKSTRWQGAGFTAKNHAIMILKVAKFHQDIEIKAGDYTLGIVGRKKSGAGGITIDLVGPGDVLINKFKVDFNSSNWSEQAFSFTLGKDYGPSKLRITRDQNALGTLELSRISLNAKFLNNEISIPKKGLPSEEVGELSSFDFSYQRPAKDRIPRDSKLYVAFVIPYGIYGGAEVYVKNLVDNFPANINVSLLYLKENELKNNIKRECNHHILEAPHLLIENIQQTKYDYIIYYNRLDVYNLLTSLKSRGDIKARLIEIYHSDFIWPGSLSSVKERSNVYKLVTISPSLARNIKGVNIQNREIVPVGIDTRLFSKKDGSALKESLGLTGKKVIGTVARLSREKNIDGIIYTAKEMPEYHFAILGEGPERARLEKLISDEKLNNITLLGHANDSYKYYNIFDAFLLLSSIEGTPISIIEAMASEVPVFTTEVGAINDLIKETITGFIVPNDPKVVAEKIRKNIDNKEVLKTARMYVEKSFNSKINSEDFLDFFFQ